VRARPERSLAFAPRPLRFGEQHLELRDVVVPLDQRGDRAGALDREAVEIPHGVDDVPVVRVDDVRAEIRVAGEVDLDDALGGNRFDERERIEPVIVGRDEHVVHVEHQADVGALRHFSDELPLRERAPLVREVARRVLERERYPQKILDFAGSVRHRAHELARERQRQEVVQVRASRAAPTKMIAHPGRLRPPDELAQAREVRGARFVGAADPERDAVLHERIELERAFEMVTRPAAGAHEVFADDLDEIDARLFGEDPLVVRDA